MTIWKEKKKLCQFKFQFQDNILLISGESQHLHLHCCPSFHNGGTSVYYMYCLVRKQLRKINVIRILQNSSFYGSLLYCLKTRQLRNIKVMRILQRASVYGYMPWVFLSNSTFTYSQIHLNSLHCILNCLQ